MKKSILLSLFIYLFLSHPGYCDKLILENGDSLLLESGDSLLLESGSALGATYTVCANGCDYTQIDSCLAGEDLGPGDVVLLRGDVTESGDVAWSADDDGDGTGVVTLNLNDHALTITGTTTAGIILGNALDGLTIDNGKLVINTAGDCHIYTEDDFADVTIQDVVFEDSETNISSCVSITLGVDETGNILVDRCTFNAPGDVGIQSEGAGVSTIVQSSAFTGFQTAMQCTGSNTTVGNCVIYNSTVGIDLASALTVEVQNTILSGCGTGFNDSTDDCDETLDYNCWYDNDTDVSNASKGANAIEADPLFVSAGSNNFGLRPTSPCIDVGNNTAASGIDTDIRGLQRIIDGNKDGIATVDIGSHEFKLKGRSGLPSGIVNYLINRR